MAKDLNPYLLNALYAWGAYRRDEDITGTGYSSETMECRMMTGVAWSHGGQIAEPDYEPNEEALRVAVIVSELPARLQNVLWAAYVGKEHPMGEDRGSQALGCSLDQYRDLHKSALARVADGLGLSLYVRRYHEKRR